MTRRAFHFVFALVLATVAAATTSCGNSTSTSTAGDGDTLTKHSTLLDLVDLGDGVVSATVRDPWNNDAVLAKYLLVEKTADSDAVSRDAGAVVVNVPVGSALVYSGVHATAFDELGVLDVVTGVADGQYFTADEIRKRIADGNIIDVGNAMSPSLEKIVALSPDIAVLSPYENSGNGILDKTGITVVQMADYMEPDPAARAEWILFIGALTGQLDRARDIYQKSMADYNAIKSLTADAGKKPLVLSETPASGVWFQPGGNSYAAAMIRDAGGIPLLDSDTSTGSVQLDVANVYERGVDADVWLIKIFGEITPDGVVAGAPKLIPNIRAFADKNVWNVNTSATSFFDDIAFHPERILRDMAVIFHSQLADSLGTPRYYRKTFSK